MNKCVLSDSALYEERYGYKYYAGLKRLLAFIIALIVVFSSAIIALRMAFVNIIVSGTSMEATLSDGDCVLMERNSDVDRGDIVIIDVSDSEWFSGNYIVKRVIALGGDEVYCKDGQVYLKRAGEADFTPLDEDYVSSRTRSFSTISVKEDEFFFLGDNRAVSRDSTEVGCLSLECIYGKVMPWAVAIKGFTTFIYKYL